MTETQGSNWPTATRQKKTFVGTKTDLLCIRKVILSLEKWNI